MEGLFYPQLVTPHDMWGWNHHVNDTQWIKPFVSNLAPDMLESVKRAIDEELQQQQKQHVPVKGCWARAPDAVKRAPTAPVSLRSAHDDDRIKARRAEQSVCNKAGCSCAFLYPTGMTRDQLHAEPVITPHVLVLFRMTGYASYSEAHAELVDAVAPIKTRHINVDTDTGMAFMVFKDHADAAEAQRVLLKQAYSVNFKCENVNEIRGR